MAKQGTILVVDDNKGILTAVQMLLGTCFEKVITISTPNKIKNTLHDENVDVVLLDMNFSAGINSGNEGLFWLSETGWWSRNIGRCTKPKEMALQGGESRCVVREL